jgi:glycosyltransferase involved in cell wall biosynthesis
LKTSVYIIIPAFNEGAVIYKTVTDLLLMNFSVVVVDDGSTDDTEVVLIDLPIHYLKHRVNLGQGAAIQTGIRYALESDAEYFVTFDADGQHSVEDVLPMLELLQNDSADVVFGSRFLPGASTNISFIRKTFIQVAKLLNFLFTGVLLSDAHNGLRAFNRKAACSFYLVESGMAHATEILIQCKKKQLRIAEYPVNILYTAYSRKKGQTLINSFKIVQDLLLYKLFK